MLYYTTYSVVPLQCYHFPAISSQKTPHSSPVRLSYGVSFVGFIFCLEWYMWYHIILDQVCHYNGTQLFMLGVYQVAVINNVLCWYLQSVAFYPFLPYTSIVQTKIYVLLEVFPRLYIIHNAAIRFWFLVCLMHTLTMPDCRKLYDQLVCKKCVRHFL